MPQKAFLIPFTVFLLGLCELTGFFSYGILRDKIHFIQPNTLTQADLKKLSLSFHPKLGWKHAKTRENFSRETQIHCFGDSFTYGDEGKATESWPSHLSRLREEPINNAGESAYGIDQSLLKYKLHKSETKNDQLILSFITNNFIRTLNIYRPFRSPSTTLTLTKPLFVYNKASQQFDLQHNPLQKPQELQKLNDPIFIQNLGKQDFWYKRAPSPVASFPYSRLLFDSTFWSSVDFLIKKYPESAYSINLDQIYQQPDFKKRIQFFIDEFFKAAQENNSTATLLHLPTQNEIAQHLENGYVPWIITGASQYCTQQGYHCLFPLLENPFADRISAASFHKGGHYTAQGNQAVAEYVNQKLKSRADETKHRKFSR